MKKVFLMALLLGGMMLLWTGCEKEPTATGTEPVVLQENTYVVDSTDYNLVSTSLELLAGTYTFTYTGTAPDVVVGDVIVGAQGEGFLRKVTTITSGTGTVTYQTTQGTMEELFKSGDIDFTMNLDSSNQFRSTTLRYDIANYSLYNQNGFTLDANGYLEFDSDLFFDFSFSGGSIDKVVFEAQNAHVVSSFTLAAAASQSVQLVDKTDTLAGFEKTYTKWVIVGGIPVPIVVVVTTNFILKYGANISAQANASVTATNDNSLQLGARYENGLWTGVYDLTPTFDLTWVPLNGTVGATITADLIPSIDVKFYGVAGPYASVELKEELAGNIASPSLEWDFTASVWLKATAGANVTVFGTTLADYNKDWTSSKLTYQTPYELLKTSGDNQTGSSNQALTNPIKVQVLDEFGNSQSNVPVYFDVTAGGGSSSITSVLSDQDGYAEAVWTLGSTGVQTMSVSAKKADATAFQSSPQVFTGQIGSSCTSTFIDPRDGEEYCQVTIGSQTWMAENLRYNASGSWINPSNPSTTYGRLYDWATVMNGAGSSSSSPSGVQGICPSGWHLPSDAEWSTLEVALGMNSSDATTTGWRGTHGTGMKSTTGWSSGAATNASGFNAFPAGYYYSGSFYNLGGSTTFWSSTEYSPTNAWTRDLSSGGTGVYRDDTNKTYGYSCRCTKD